jgi:hypothetical protein
MAGKERGKKRKEGSSATSKRNACVALINGEAAIFQIFWSVKVKSAPPRVCLVVNNAATLRGKLLSFCQILGFFVCDAVAFNGGSPPPIQRVTPGDSTFLIVVLNKAVTLVFCPTMQVLLNDAKPRKDVRRQVLFGCHGKEKSRESRVLAAEGSLPVDQGEKSQKAALISTADGMGQNRSTPIG